MAPARASLPAGTLPVGTLGPGQALRYSTLALRTAAHGLAAHTTSVWTHQLLPASIVASGTERTASGAPGHEKSIARPTDPSTTGHCPSG